MLDLSPQTVGIDMSRRAVDVCNKSYPPDRLSFTQRNAESIPLADNLADVVINVQGKL